MTHQLLIGIVLAFNRRGDTSWAERQCSFPQAADLAGAGGPPGYSHRSRYRRRVKENMLKDNSVLARPLDDAPGMLAELVPRKVRQLQFAFRAGRHLRSR